MTSTTASEAAATGRLSGTRSATQPKPLAGLENLLRFMARRDRIRTPVWITAVVVLAAIGSASVVALYPTPADLDLYSRVASADVALKAMAGPGYGLDNPTIGAVVMNEMAIFTHIAMALMAIFMVIRHTRAEEDTDRAELVRAAPVGRDAALVGSGIWVGAMCVVIGVGITLGMLACGLPLTGSVAFGSASAAFGLVFVGVAATAAQMASSARAALALAGATLGIFFVMRAVGDMGNGWMTWLSPLGWAMAIRAYADESWWVLLLLVATAVGFFSGALALSARRDLGHGILTQRPGPAHGAGRLATPFALATRLQRASLLGWTIGIGLMAFFFGIVADEASALAENEAIAELFAAAGGGSVTEAFLATMVSMSALIGCGFTVSAVLRLRSEEVAVRAEPILATPVSRPKWLWSHLAVSMIGSATIMTVAGLMIGLGYAAQIGDLGEILPVLGASVVMLPAMWMLAAFAAALIGLVPRFAMVAWAALALVVVVGFLGESLNLPQWLRDLSPFEHVPALPVASFDAVPLMILLAVAAGFVTLATIGIRRRDIG